MTTEQEPSSKQAAVKDIALDFWQQTEQAHWHRVSGISMWPFLKHGDSVFVQPTSGTLQVGDVALIRFPNRLVIHRVTRINKEGSAVAWGDFNLRPDPIAMPSQVMGVASSIKRKERTISFGTSRRVWGSTVIYCRPLLIPLVIVARKLLRLKQIYSKRTV